jgi:hypothetical protein
MEPPYREEVVEIVFIAFHCAASAIHQQDNYSGIPEEIKVVHSN